MPNILNYNRGGLANTLAIPPTQSQGQLLSRPMPVAPQIDSLLLGGILLCVLDHISVANTCVRGREVGDAQGAVALRLIELLTF